MEAGPQAWRALRNALVRQGFEVNDATSEAAGNGRHRSLPPDPGVNFEAHEVKVTDGVFHLTSKEFKLLHCLASPWGPDYGDEIPANEPFRQRELIAPHGVP